MFSLTGHIVDTVTLSLSQPNATKKYNGFNSWLKQKVGSKWLSGSHFSPHDYTQSQLKIQNVIWQL